MNKRFWVQFLPPKTKKEKWGRGDEREDKKKEEEEKKTGKNS